MACIIEKVIPGVRSLSIRWVDGHISTFHYLWLADNSPQSLNGKGQRLHDTMDLPSDIRPRELYYSSEKGLEISWEQLPQPSFFSAVWLKMHCYSHQREIPQFSPWPGKDVNCDDFKAKSGEPYLAPGQNKLGGSTDEVDLIQAMRVVRLEGIATVQADSNLHGIRDLLKQGTPQADLSTNFNCSCECELQGLWEMRSWSPQWSGMHTEHPDWKSIPAFLRIRVLPSLPLRWELVLVDGFHFAEILRVHNPRVFALLSSIPVQFKENMRQPEPGVFRSIIELNEAGAVTGVHYDPRSLAPFSISPGQMLDFYHAYQTFGRMIRDPRYQKRCRMLPGKLFIIDNHRMLHGVLPATMTRNLIPEGHNSRIEYPEPCLLEV